MESWDMKSRSEFSQLDDEHPKLSQQFVSLFPVLQDKNRYRSVMPLPEETRVHLQLLGGIGSDYINANFVSGETENSSHYYIACQAPIERTMEDFWRMIWEQNCGVIVMLTGLTEGSSIKAHCYWPEEGKIRRFGNFVICHKKSFKVGEVTVRSLLVRQSTPNSNTAREIIQLQYEDWPDHSVPETTKTIQELLILMTKFKSRATSTHNLEGPVVVHCSAGLGRTGVFIAAHITLLKVLTGERPNVKKTVELLRKQRAKMVRNEHQYEFIFSIIEDCVKNGTIKELALQPLISPPTSPRTKRTYDEFVNSNSESDSSSSS